MGDALEQQMCRGTPFHEMFSHSPATDFLCCVEVLFQCSVPSWRIEYPNHDEECGSGKRFQTMITDQYSIGELSDVIF